MEREEKGVTEVLVTGEGELVEAEAYVMQRVLHGVSGGADLVSAGGDGSGGSPALASRVVAVEKAWRETRRDQDRRDILDEAGVVASPPLPFSDLLFFYDVNTWHRRCVLVKALLVAGLGWQLVEGDPNDGGAVVYDPQRDEAVPDHPAARLLARPNASAMEPFEELMFRFAVDYFATGNAMLEVGRDRRGRVAELFHAPVRTMRRARDLRRQAVAYYQVKAGRRQPFVAFGAQDWEGELLAVRMGRSEIVHQYEYDPLGDYYGMPGWLGALANMGMDRTVLEYNTRLFRNNLMATWAVVVQGGRLSKAGRDALKQFIADQALGVKKHGRLLLMENEDDGVTVEFKRLDAEIKEMMIVESQKHFRDVVIGAHGVPPRILGIVTPGQLGATGEVQGQLLIFQETVLRAEQQRLERTLGVVLDEVYRSWGLEGRGRVRFKEMDITSIKDDGEFWKKMVEALIYSPAEARQLIETGARR